MDSELSTPTRAAAEPTGAGARQQSAILRCECCSEAIGAYELMVVIDDGSPHFTTRGRLREAGLKADETYHGECWEQLHGSL